jgi:anti-sigma factor RsiW
MHPNETVIHDYLDDALDVRARTELERHLAGCAQCRRLVDDLRDIRKAFAGLKDDLREPPVRAWGRLERAIRLEHESRSTPSPQSSQRELAPRAQRALRSLPWLAAAAVLILATAVGLQYRGGRATPTSPSATPGPSIASGDAAGSGSRAARR